MNWGGERERKGFPKAVRVNLGSLGARSPTWVERSAEGTGGKVQGETGSQSNWALFSGQQGEAVLSRTHLLWLQMVMSVGRGQRRELTLGKWHL